MGYLYVFRKPRPIRRTCPSETTPSGFKEEHRNHRNENLWWSTRYVGGRRTGKGRCSLALEVRLDKADYGCHPWNQDTQTTYGQSGDSKVFQTYVIKRDGIPEKSNQ